MISLELEIGKRTADAIAERLQVVSGPHSDEPEMDIRRELRDVYHSFLGVAARLPGLVKLTWGAVEAGYHPAIHSDVTVEMFDQLIRVSVELRAVARLHADALSPAEVDEMENAISAISEQRNDFAHNGPRFTKEDVDKAREEAARGECLELDDAFAEIAGVSPEAWRERVRKHQG